MKIRKFNTLIEFFSKALNFFYFLLCAIKLRVFSPINNKSFSKIYFVKLLRYSKCLFNSYIKEIGGTKNPPITTAPL